METMMETTTLLSHSLLSSNKPCTPALIAASLSTCVAPCVDGPTIIKRSLRLSWLSMQQDVQLRSRGFFSPASCLRCLSAAQLPPSCDGRNTTVATLRSAILIAQGGVGQSRTPLDSDLSFLANIVERRSAFLFYTMQCTNQCADVSSTTRRAACYCRACATLPEWVDFVTFCSRYFPPDLPECRQLAPLFVTDCTAASQSAGASSVQSPTTATTLADGVPLDAAFISSCRTAFNTSCCPMPPAAASISELRASPPSMAPLLGGSSTSAEPCGGPSRGVCVDADTWLSAQMSQGHLAPSDHSSCFWPRSYGAARCLCEPRFAGHDCGGCAKGYAGANCRTPRAPEVRRPFGNVTFEEASHWASHIGRMLHMMPPAVTFAAENEVEMVHEFNRAFHASNWLNHFHILYFEEWLEGVRRATGDYTTPYFYFDPSSTHALEALNGYMERAERAIVARKQAAHETAHQQHPHRGRRFRLAFPGNLPPSSVDVLVDRLPTYFPYTLPYNRDIFNTSLAAAPGSTSSSTSTGGGAAASAPMAEDVSLPGTFSAYFQRLHAIHQMVLVGGGPLAGSGGPCTPSEKHGFPERGALGCLPLGPSHAFYEYLLRRWMDTHGDQAACALRSDEDVPAEACVPFLLPLTRLKDLCDPQRRAWHSYIPS